MDGLAAYVLSVAAGSVLCTLAVNLAGEEGTTAAIIRLVCGIIMASIVIRPLGSIPAANLTGYFEDLDTQVCEAVSAGEEQAQQVLSQRIKEQTQAYILDKAAELGLALEVEVILDDSAIPVPVRVELRGSAAPGARTALEEIIARDLGIGKEDQIWK